MISRPTARALAELIEADFCKYHPGYTLPDIPALYDFLYDHDYEPWFCNLVKGINRAAKTRVVKELFMRLHTGETQAAATKGWEWDQRQQLGQRYLTDLAQDLLRRWKIPPRDCDYEIRKKAEALLRRLELDGFAWDGEHLLQSEEDTVDAQEEIGVVRSLYRDAGLGGEDVAFHHLALSEDHYLAARWEDSIGNSRKFLEATLQQVAARYAQARGGALQADALSRPARVRDYLEEEGLLEQKEKQAVASVYGLLSETGGHPYMAQKEQARLMRHLALTFAQFVILRLRGALGSAT